MSVASEAPVTYIRVAVERGIDRYPEGLVYRVESAMATVAPGARVEVPLGRGDRAVAGVVVATGGGELLDRGLSASRVKTALRVDRSQPPLPIGLVQLAQWISSYYCAPIGVTLASMTPAAVRKGVGTVKRALVSLAPSPPEGQVHPKRRAILDALAARGEASGPMELEELREHCGLATKAPITALIRSGHLHLTHRSEVHARWTKPEHTESAPPTLTDEQSTAVDAIGTTLGNGFSQHLLFGVTGSGKTEVYLRLAERVLAAGRCVLVLVPEIALTPQTWGRLASRLSAHPIAVLHSGLTAAQRHEQWIAAAQMRAGVVVGARSAVFAPIPDGQLGLVVVDEEHDHSYKQDQAPRYHGRDVAIRRAQLAGCPVVLGSATPSLESWWNASSRGVSTLHTLSRRPPGMRTPRVEVVDFRVESRLRPDRRVHLIGPTLEFSLREAFNTGGQAIVLLNRRGYANWIACADQSCGWMMRCDHCEAGMVVHLGTRLTGMMRTTRCHHCQAMQTVPQRCPRCAKGVTIFGLGTQRVEEELARLFPELAEAGAMARVDSDTMGSSVDFHRTLDAFGRGDIRLLLGTQMIAKGLDFPNVRVVGVISADTALNLPDFRASERTFQLVAQVSGRCGRGENAGRAIVQTFQPDAPPIVAAAAQDYESFARAELALRVAHGLPPATRLARVIFRDERHEVAERLAADAASALRKLPGHRDIVVHDPAPCPIARIADRARIQVEIFCPRAADLQRLIAAARNAGILVPGEAIAVDVDPVALL
jgi:primosomal protein N' (replication factor Y)